MCKQHTDASTGVSAMFKVFLILLFTQASVSSVTVFFLEMYAFAPGHNLIIFVYNVLMDL